MSETLFNAEFNMDSYKLGGPITTTDSQEYLFVNRYTGDDIYFKLKEIENGQWRQTWGAASFNIPQEIIDTVGKQIEGNRGQ